MNNSLYEMVDGGQCLRIKNRNTPMPWENFLYTDDGKYTMRMTQRGLGKTSYNYGANNVSNGKNFCLKDLNTEQVWSLNGGYSPDRADNYYCDFMPGKIVFTTEHNELKTTLTVVVDPYSYLEVYSLQIENSSSEPRPLQLTACDFTQLEGSDNTQQLEQTRFDENSGAIVCQRIHSKTADNKYAAFMVADMKPSSFCGSSIDFLGGDCRFEDAIVWKTDRLPNVNAYAFQPLMALRYDIKVEAGDVAKVNLGYGIADNFDDAEKMASEFLDNGVVGTVISSSENYFKKLTGKDELSTPNENLNALYNVWNRIQLHWQNCCARSSQMHNWRNNLQDSMGWLVVDPKFARKRLTEICSLAHEDGFMQRSTPKLEGGEQNHQRHMDIATWAGLCASRYAKETGDIEFFNKKVKYASGSKRASVIECLVNGIMWLLKHRGQHGMVLFLDGDWSDPLEEAGKRGIGESPWTSVALVNAINELVPLLRTLKMDNVAEELIEEAKSLTDAVNEHAWDGDWYIRGITDDGVRFCTKDDPDANVSLMMQAWSIISGVAPRDRVDQVLKALKENCKTDIGPILYGPPFLTERPELGRESVKRPGTGENGSCYTHAATMLAWAENTLDLSDDALGTIQSVMPLSPVNSIDTTMSCPLWWPNFYQGPHAEFPGRSSNKISSGAPAWFMMNISEGLLGVTPRLDGLKISPALPTGWDNVEFARHWRNSAFNFEFVRSGNGAGCKVLLDGKPVENALIKPQPAGGEYSVMVIV